ncbi:MAG: D-2-hydroxyacid dehydrogenase [Defluviitaleaceae bacterium]|nr:D-2-hydroxyacid dehydrogenase [Defluviitaleaceae bacterium]
MKRKIGVCFSGISDARLAKISAAAPDFEVISVARDSEELLDCDIIFGGASPEVLARAAKLRWFHTQTSGVDYYLKQEICLGPDVVLTNSAGAYGIGIAEHLLAMALMLMRKMDGYGRLQTQQTWQDLGVVKTLYGSLVTVVGLGDIGSNFAARCRAMGATVRGVVRNPRSYSPDCVDALFSAEQLDEAIADADVVALCLPGTPQTDGLFDAARLDKMKRGALILNVGRGGAIDANAMVERLVSGHLGGAGLDVTSPEPLPVGHPLWSAPNTIITPHVSGGDSLDLTQDLIADKFVRYLEDYIAGRPLEHVVDRQVGY